MEKLVTIVLPVYNGERFLEEAIKSVLNQTYRNIELIIVNDYSTDSSEEIIKEYLSVDSRIKYYKNETNLKLPRSLNVGFSHASGEYLTWTSDDNMYHSDAIETMATYLDEHPEVSLVYADCNSIDAEGNTVGYFEAGASEELIYHNTVGACFMYTRDVRNEIGNYDASLFLVEDLEYWLRINLRHVIHPLNVCLYEYRYHDKNLTATREQEIYQAKSKLMWLYLEKYETIGMPEKDLFNYFNFILRYKETLSARRKEQLKFGLRHPKYFLLMISNGTKTNQ